MDLIKANTQQTAIKENQAEAFPWLFLALLALFSLAVLFPVFPGLFPISGVDTGTSQWIGSQIAQGKIPYRDFWDTQPPLIHFINWFGFTIGGASQIGIWALKLISLLAFSAILFRGLSRYFGSFVSFWAAAGAVLCVSAIPGFSKSVELYGLPFQAAVLFLLTGIDEHPSKAWRYLVLGCCIGLLSSLRITLFGIGLAAGLYLLIKYVYRRNWEYLLRLLWVLAGFALVWVVWAIIFLLAHSIQALFDQVFRYTLFSWRTSSNQRLNLILLAINTLFHGAAFFTFGLLSWLAVVPYFVLREPTFRNLISSRFTAIASFLVGAFVLFNGVYDDINHRLFSLQALSLYRILLIAVGAAFIALSVYIWTKGLRKLITSLSGLPSGLFLPLCIAVVDLPLELGLGVLLGEVDYWPSVALIPFVTALIPSVAILLAFMLWSLISNEPSDQRGRAARFTMFIVISGVVITSVMSTYNLTTAQPWHRDEIPILQKYFKANAKPGDTLLQWSAYPELYSLTGMAPASRYLDLQPLFTQGYVDSTRLQTFLNELRSAPPTFIVYTRYWKSPMLLPTDKGPCSQLQDENILINLQEVDRFRWDDPLAKRPYIPAGMSQVYQWICENYQVAGEAGNEPWFIYKLKTANP